MKKILVTIITIFGVFGFNKIVFAAATSATESGHPNEYSQLLSEYNKGITTTNISSTGVVTLYGKSNCSSATKSCTYSYVNGITDVETVLSKSVVCTNGEKNINYQDYGSGGTGFKSDNKDNADGNVMWSEDYYITCTSDSSSGGIQIENPVNSGNSSDNNISGGNDSTVDSPETGVETYYIVLGIVAIISYGFMVISKKYNLFKKI